MYPHERSLIELTAGKPFAIVGVNSDPDRKSIREIAAKKNLNWRSFWDGPNSTDGPIATQWRVTAWPTNYLIDAKGIIRFKHIHGNRMDRAIELLLDELGESIELTGKTDLEPDH